MSTIESDGFLSPELHRHIDECRRRHAGWFELLTRANRLGQSLLKEVRIEPTNLQQSIACLFYIRLLGHAQAAVILIERCMPTQSEVLCRASLETLFGLVAVVYHADTAQLLVRGDRHHRLKLLKATLRRGETVGADAVKEATLVLDELKKDLAEDPDAELTTWSLAERAGLLPLYDSAYRILSLSVHSNLRDLERQLSLNADGNPSTINWGPNFESLDESLMLVGDVFIRGTNAICSLFNLGHQEELEAIRRCYSPLAARILERMPNQSVESTAEKRRDSR